MKLSKRNIIPDFLVALFPIALVLPNVILSFFGSWSYTAIVTNILLPLGIYYFLITLSKKTGLISVLFLPFCFFAAFQIVVTYMFKDSHPIAVDMFMNLFTTNSTEVHELLAGIIFPVCFCVITYGTLLILGGICLIKHYKAQTSFITNFRKTSIVLMGLGVICLGISYWRLPDFSFTRKVFPANAMANACKAVGRHHSFSRYDDTSQGFKFSASSAREKDGKELYIAVVGETSRADNWSIFGYNKPTTPLLGQLGDSIFVYPKVFSESNITHKSVPMLLSTLDSSCYKDSINRHKSVISAFNEAGFHTVFLSNQEKNNSYIEKYANEAASTIFMPRQARQIPYDLDLLPLVDSVLNNTPNEKVLLVIHSYGSHYSYPDRYATNMAPFTPDKVENVSYKNKNAILNSYDNTIYNTDFFLNELISRIKNLDYNAALIYTSDHGEDIYDDSRKRFLHASPSPTYWQLHVPLCIFMNEKYKDNYPNLAQSAASSINRIVSSSKSFAPTLLHLADINTPYLDYKNSLLYEVYSPPENILFLDDSNNALNLKEAGFSKEDFAMFSKKTVD